MFHSLLYVLLFYNVVHGYKVLDRARREKHHSIDSVVDNSRINSLENLLKEQHVFEDALENWTGRWMPDRDPKPTAIPKTHYDNASSRHSGGVPMGPSDNCDDGQTNLEVDWNHSPVNHTCYGQRITPDLSTDPTIYCEHIPENYQALHMCMSDNIEYDDAIPTYGNHRPVWPVYGEYKFLPKQRWLHSLEHGGVVMLYHPCANPLEVQRLKDIVKSCLRRHVITPYSLVNETRPLVLVAWGCRLEMSYVNVQIIRNFIRAKALRGPEAISKDGMFSDGLINKSTIVTDKGDTTLCPQH
ncbi:uncharacterized protein LOC135161567 [Diachasmimorpha longicaudata]|uniref:uncharacterized protein LOC135161567 n=1 Tax=Diachasmimorpha longicaudata TaxID=58733 RepID=UPI0030B8CCB1